MIQKIGSLNKAKAYPLLLLVAILLYKWLQRKPEVPNNIIPGTIKSKRALNKSKLENFFKQNPFKIENAQTLLKDKNIPELIELIQSRQVSTTDMVVYFAFQVKSIAQGQNLLSEINFQKSLEETQKLFDKSQAESVQVAVPYALEDPILLQNLDSSYGMTSQSFLPKHKDSFIVQILKKAGFVPLVKANPAAFCLPFDLQNPLFEKPLNLYNNSQSLARLVSSGSVPFGLGIDILGSSRSSSIREGIVCFVPTPSRLPQVQIHKYIDFNLIRPEFSVLAKSIDDLESVMERVLSQEDISGGEYKDAEDFDKTYFVKKWNPNKGLQAVDSNLKVGYISQGESVENPYQNSIEALKQNGYDCIEFPFQNFQAEVVSLSEQVYTLMLENKPLLNDLEQNGLRIVRERGSIVLTDKTEKKLPFLLEMMKALRSFRVYKKNVSSYQERIEKVAAAIEELRKSFEKVWTGLQLDLLLTPGLLNVVEKEQNNRLNDNQQVFLQLAALCKLPSGIFPIIQTQKMANNFQFSNGNSSNGSSKLLNHCPLNPHPTFNTQSIHVIGTKFSDELCVQLIKKFAQIIKKSAKQENTDSGH